MFVVNDEFRQRIERMTVTEEELPGVGFPNVIMLHHTATSWPGIHTRQHNTVKLRYNGLLGTMQKRPLYQRSLVSTVCHRHLIRHNKKVKVAHTRLQSVRFRSWSQFLTVNLQVMWVINPAVGCHYFPPGPQLPPQPLRELLPISLLGEERHNGCEQFA